MIPIDYSAHERMLKKYGRYLTNHCKPETTTDEGPRLCIEGKAVLTDEPIMLKTGEVIVIERGAFKDHFANERRTEVWFGHDDKDVVGSTDTGLELLETSDGYAFRLPLTDKRYTDKIKRMITSGKQAAISVGITHKKSREEMIGRHKVIFVESAELREISLVAAGACSKAFVRLIDAESALPLEDSIHSVSFKIDATMHDLKALSAKHLAWMDSLNARLDVLESQPSRKIRGPNMWEMQTAETERLQQEARRKHYSRC